MAVSIPVSSQEFSNLVTSFDSISKVLRWSVIMIICAAERWSSIWEIVSSSSLLNACCLISSNVWYQIQGREANVPSKEALDVFKQIYVQF